LSYDIIKTRGGEIGVESKEGEGSEFISHHLFVDLIKQVCLKKVLIIFVIICSVQVLFAQITPNRPKQRHIDSLKQALLASTNDTLRLVLANELGYNYLMVNTNLDSTLIYSRQVFALAHRLGYKIDEAYALDMIGSILNFQHNENTLETFFKGVKIAEDPQIENKILPRKYLELITYWNPDFTSLLKKNNWSPNYFRLSLLGGLYEDLGQAYGKAIPNRQRLFFYMSKAIELYKSQKDTASLALTYENIAEYFYSSNLDSSLYYAHKADTLRRIYNKRDLKYTTYPLLGEIYFKKGNDSLALHFARQFIQKRPGSGLYIGWDWQPYFTLAEYFLKNSMIDSSMIDSSFYYATEAYTLATLPENLQPASALLAKLYKRKGLSDSALKYYEMALALSDTLNDASKKAQLQKQDFEQQREQEELEQEKAREKFYILFTGFAISLVALSVIGFILLRNIRLKRKKDQLQHLMAEAKIQLENRRKEQQLAELQQQKSELEMQALRSQMNPHFIFNSLNSINMFILENNKLQASEYLSKFSKLVRLILQNSQEAFIPLESELEALQLYLELESLRFENKFEYKISVDDEVDTSVLKVPPLIIQPFAENAIWHGLMNKEGEGHLSINIQQENSTLICTIADDGIGRKKAAELKNKSGKHRSMGMKITESRIAMMQKMSEENNSVEIRDLVDADGNAAGTEVLLRIPVARGA